MLTLMVLCFFTIISRDAAQRWPFIDSLNRDEPFLDYVETQDDYGDANEAYFDNAYDEMEPFWAVDDYDDFNFEDYIQTRDMPDHSIRRNKEGCIEKETYFNVSAKTKWNISGIIHYPIIYRDVTCSNVSDSQQHAALYPTCYNHKCETTHGKIPVFIRVERTGCWKHIDSIPVETGCMCGR